MTQGQGYHEAQDPRTGKAPEHQRNALRHSDISNVEIRPTKYKDLQYKNTGGILTNPEDDEYIKWFEKKGKGVRLDKFPILPGTEEFECVLCGMKNLKLIDSTEEKCAFCKRTSDLIQGERKEVPTKKTGLINRILKRNKK